MCSWSSVLSLLSCSVLCLCVWAFLSPPPISFLLLRSRYLSNMFLLLLLRICGYCFLWVGEGREKEEFSPPCFPLDLYISLSSIPPPSLSRGHSPFPLVHSSLPPVDSFSATGRSHNIRRRETERRNQFQVRNRFESLGASSVTIHRPTIPKQNLQPKKRKPPPSSSRSNNPSPSPSASSHYCSLSAITSYLPHPQTTTYISSSHTFTLSPPPHTLHLSLTRLPSRVVPSPVGPTLLSLLLLHTAAPALLSCEWK